jgi:hypothetical protein
MIFMAKTGAKNNQNMVVLGRSLSHEKTVRKGINPMERPR